MSPRDSDTLRVGDAAPDFTLPDAANELITRSRWQAGQPLLLMFFRGTWCPQCRAQMGHLAADAAAFAGRGVRVLGVAAQQRSRLSAYLDRNPLPFPILADEDRTISRAYGVYVAINFESLRIARPSSFLLDQRGTVLWLHVGSNQFDRPRPDEVLARIDALRSMPPVNPTGVMEPPVER